MSSRTGLKKTDGQRLGPILAALCGPFTPTLEAVSKHPSPVARKLFDVLVQAGGLHPGRPVARRDLSAGGVPARLFTPEGLGPDAPLLVQFHGGGFVVGSMDSHSQASKFIARTAGCKVLSVGYRKAPKHPYPAAVDDCTKAFRWAVTHPAELGVDPARIAVGGDSAGGNAAVVVCLDTAQDELRPKAAWLMYPVVDTEFGSWPSERLFAEGPILSLNCARTMFEQYTGSHPGKDPRISVLHSDALGSLPPTYLAVAGMDILRDQGIDFAERARQAGAEVVLQRFDRLPHAFYNLLVDPRARAATTASCSVLKRMLAV